jgi:hypothetical protein
MKKGTLIVVVVLASLLMANGALAMPQQMTATFMAQLSGQEEVPPRDTNARGSAIFRWSSGADELQFKLMVANIENVFAAHIHCGAVGVNGPVGVTLFMGSVGSGPVNGILSAGTISTPDPGNACGWATMTDVVAAIRSGNTYVNVHTNDGVDPANTGPGDFPGGEIRGQIRLAGPR